MAATPTKAVEPAGTNVVVSTNQSERQAAVSSLSTLMSIAPEQTYMEFEKHLKNLPCRLSHDTLSENDIREHSAKGTTCLMIVLRDAIIIGTDSRVTGYRGGIRGTAVKLHEISAQPPTMMSRCNDMTDSAYIVNRVSDDVELSGRMTFDQIIENTRYHVKHNHSNQGFSLQIGSMEAGRPKAYYLEHYVSIDHVVGCEDPLCNCPRWPIFCERNWREGAYGMGSGSEYGIRHLGELYGKAIHVDRETLNHQLTGRIRAERSEAKDHILHALFVAALNDPLSGPPFRVAEITPRGIIGPQLYSFTDVCTRFDYRTHILRSFEDQAAYFVYPRELDGEDNAKVILKSDSLIVEDHLQTWGHALAYLRGGYYVRLVTFKNEEEFIRVFKSERLQRVEKPPPFYGSNNCEDLRFYYIAVPEMKGKKRVRVAHKIYMFRIWTCTVDNLVELTG